MGRVVHHGHDITSSGAGRAQPPSRFRWRRATRSLAADGRAHHELRGAVKVGVPQRALVAGKGRGHGLSDHPQAALPASRGRAQAVVCRVNKECSPSMAQTKAHARPAPQVEVHAPPKQVSARAVLSDILPVFLPSGPADPADAWQQVATRPPITARHALPCTPRPAPPTWHARSPPSHRGSSRVPRTAAPPQTRPGGWPGRWPPPPGRRGGRAHGPRGR